MEQSDRPNRLGNFLENQYEAIRCSDSAVVQYFATDGSGEERKEKENEK